MKVSGRRNKVDERVELLTVAVGAKAKVVNALDHRQHTKSFLGIGRGGNKCFTRFVDVAVVKVWVINLVGILRIEIKTLIVGPKAVSPGADVRWKVEQGIKSALKLRDKASSGIDV